jgi:hypothetical protein
MAGDNRPHSFLKTVLRTIGETICARVMCRAAGETKKGRRRAPPEGMGEESERGRIADPLTLSRADNAIQRTAAH